MRMKNIVYFVKIRTWSEFAVVNTHFVRTLAQKIPAEKDIVYTHTRVAKVVADHDSLLTQ